MSLPTARRIRSIAIGAVLGLVLGTAAVAASPAQASTPTQDEPVTLRLGYFGNVTHAHGARRASRAGTSRTRSATASTSRLSTFNAGPAAVEALLSDALDVTLHRPEPGDQRRSRSPTARRSGSSPARRPAARTSS